MDESSGGDNVMVEAETPTADRPQSPFDWRQVQVKLLYLDPSLV